MDSVLLEADIVSSLGDMVESWCLYDEAIANAPTDRPKIYLSFAQRCLYPYSYQNDIPSAQRKMEIFEFPDHHLYLQYNTENRVTGYSIDGLLSYTH